MPDTTVYYGFRIPKLDGSDYQVPDDIRIPITAIDTALVNKEPSIIDTGWLPNTNIQATFNAPSGGMAMTSRLVGKLVMLRGTQRANAATIGAVSQIIGTLPAGSRPSTLFVTSAIGWINGGTNQLCDITIAPSGNITIIPNAVLTGVYFDGISFLVG